MESLSSVLLAGLLAGAATLLPAPLSAAPPAVAAHGGISEALDRARTGDLAPIRRLLGRKALTPVLRHLFEARLHASNLNDAAAKAALARYFAGGDRDLTRVRQAHEIGASTAFAAGRYADAARHGAQVVARPEGLHPKQIDGIRRLAEIASLLAASPGQRLERREEKSTAIFRDQAGLIRTRITSGEATEEAILDTGANLSVASVSAAGRMGLRMLDGVSTVGNSVGTQAEVRVGIADRLDIAGARLRNVVFLVIDDKTLEFPGGYRIDTIIGFPVMRALGRLSFGPGDTLKVGGARGSGVKASPLRMVGNMPYVVATIENSEHPLVLDSGATNSVLHHRFALARPDLKVADSGKIDRTAGAGGIKEVRVGHYPKLSAIIGGERVELKDMPVEIGAKSEPDESFGVIGIEILNLFGRFTVDFDRMTFEAVKK